MKCIVEEHAIPEVSCFQVLWKEIEMYSVDEIKEFFNVIWDKSIPLSLKENFAI